jgi:hypothetical protein
MHAPLSQRCPLAHGGHFGVQPPSAHASLGLVRAVHVPETHDSLDEQARSHVPQCDALDSVSTHEAPHSKSPGSQWLAQLPCEHTSFSAHAWPHAPQFRGSA